MNQHGFPIELKFESKNPLSQETFSQFWTLWVEIWLFLTTSLNFLFSLIVGQSFRPVMFLYFFCTFVKFIQPINILAILKYRSGNMGTWEPSLSSSQPLSISSSCWLWVEVSGLLCFYTFFVFLLLAFLFSLVKAPLTFYSLYVWNFGLNSSQ